MWQVIFRLIVIKDKAGIFFQERPPLLQAVLFSSVSCGFWQLLKHLTMCPLNVFFLFWRKRLSTPNIRIWLSIDWHAIHLSDERKLLSQLASTGRKNNDDEEV